MPGALAQQYQGERTTVTKQNATADVSIRARALRSAALGVTLSLVAGPVLAQEVTTTHGYNFFGSLAYGPDFEHLSYVNPDAPTGGEISIWAQGTFDSFNNYTRKGRPGALATSGHEDLLTSVADDPTALYCNLCTTMEYPEDLAWVIYNLRDDVTFADGRPWSAQDLKFTFDLFMEQGLPSFRAAFGAMIASVEVLDTHRVKFHFQPDSPPRDRISLSGIFPAFSESWFNETGARLDESTLVPFLGTGEYALESYEINQRIVYKRRDDYWGRDLPLNIGRGNFDQIRVEYFGDSTASMEGLKAGVYTFRMENSSKAWATSYDFPGVTDGHVIKTELPDGRLAQPQAFVFNLRREKFQDRRVREAIGQMFNFEWSNESLFFGLYDRVESFWGNSDMQATGIPDGAERELLQALVDDGLLDGSILTTEAILPPVSGTRRLDRRALRRASALMDEAGWEVGDDGLRRKNGEVFTIEILESSPAFDRIINPFVENLKALGIDAKLDRVDPAQDTQRQRDFDFDMTTHSMRQTYEPGSGLLQWFGTEAMDQSTRNLMGLSDPAVDSLIATIVAAETQEDMKNGVRALDRVLRKKLFWVPQWYKNVHTVAYYDQYEHPDPLPPLSLGHLDFWWFNQEKHDALVASGALR